nr:putative LAGLIDADG endonuclease [Candida bohioensis]AGW07351.1 putative LAGLIDADG endonuclease [Candida bohioensis]
MTLVMYMLMCWYIGSMYNNSNEEMMDQSSNSINTNDKPDDVKMSMDNKSVDNEMMNEFNEFNDSSMTKPENNIMNDNSIMLPDEEDSLDEIINKMNMNNTKDYPTDNFNFNNFYKMYNMFMKYNKVPTEEFLIKFMGFFEGHGHLLNKNNKLYFYITHKDKEMLNYMVSMLGFGHVSKMEKKSYRLNFSSLESMMLLYNLINGNLVLPSNMEKLNMFMNEYNKNVGMNMNNEFTQLTLLMKTDMMPTTNHSWLSGYTDAKGCFTISMMHRSFKIRFMLTINDIEDMEMLFLTMNNTKYDSGLPDVKMLGDTQFNDKSNNTELMMNGLKNMQYMMNYFKKYNLTFSKGTSYTKFMNVYNKLKNKEHLNPKLRKSTKKLSKDINMHT